MHTSHSYERVTETPGTQTALANQQSVNQQQQAANNSPGVHAHAANTNLLGSPAFGHRSVEENAGDAGRPRFTAGDAAKIQHEQLLKLLVDGGFDDIARQLTDKEPHETNATQESIGEMQRMEQEIQQLLATPATSLNPDRIEDLKKRVAALSGQADRWRAAFKKITDDTLSGRVKLEPAPGTSPGEHSIPAASSTAAPHPDGNAPEKS